MTNKSIIHSDSAPKAIGTYSQAVKADNTVYLSGHITLDTATMELVQGDISVQIKRVFENLKAVCEAAGGSLQYIVKLSIYLTDLAHFTTVIEIMATYFQQPYSARATVGVAQLPKGALVEMDGVMVV